MSAFSNMMSGTEIFRALGRAPRPPGSSQFRYVRLPARGVLFRQGDEANALYYVLSGQLRAIHEGAHRRELGSIGPGEVVGEVAVVTGQARTATVEAVLASELIIVERGSAKELLGREPSTRLLIAQVMRQRLVERVLAIHAMFANLSREEQRHLASRFRFLELGAGDRLVEQDQYARSLLVLLAGRAVVSRRQDGLLLPLGTLGEGDVCAEISLLTAAPTMASAVAESPCLAIEIAAADVRDLMDHSPAARAFLEQTAMARLGSAAAFIEEMRSYSEGRVKLV